MINELSSVVLNRDIEEYGLQIGDIGTVVHCYEDKLAFEVEFVNGQGETIAVLTLESKDIRPMHSKEILHVREMSLV